MIKLPFALSILLSLSGSAAFSQTNAHQKTVDPRPMIRLNDNSFVVCDQISTNNSSQVVTISGSTNLETPYATVQNAARIEYDPKVKSFTVFHAAMMRVGSATIQSEKIEYIPATGTVNVLQ
jgi:hypothetical protein